MNNEIKLFEGNKIRSVWDNNKEEWYFSIIDIVEVLMDSKNPIRYWSYLKKMKEEAVSHSQGLEENKKVVKCDGIITGNARKSIEAKTGKPAITYKKLY